MLACPDAARLVAIGERLVEIGVADADDATLGFGGDAVGSELGTVAAVRADDVERRARAALLSLSDQSTAESA
jgi:hypothetical protein